MDGHLAPASLGLVSVLTGAALFVYGVMVVEDAVSLSGLVLTGGGTLAAAASAIRARRAVAVGVVAAVDALVLAVVAWIVWTLLHQTT